MSNENECKFVVSWVGKCRRTTLLDSHFCDEHVLLKCAGCGNTATRDCDHTGIQFVCGAPLCESCCHQKPKPGEEGMFLMGGGHGPSLRGQSSLAVVVDGDSGLDFCGNCGVHVSRDDDTCPKCRLPKVVK